MCISRASFKLQILPSCSVRFYRRTRENLFKYFRECILSDHILNFHNLHESLLGLEELIQFVYGLQTVNR